MAGGQSALRAGASRNGHSRVGSRLAAAATAFAALVGTAATNGGYFPTDYGWSALAFLLVAATAVLVLDRVSLGLLDWALLAALAAFTGWIGLSATWSTSLAQPLLELERAILYLAAAFALLLITRKTSVASLLAGLLAGITAVCAYALATRLHPDKVGDFEPAGGYQLAEPLGYSNALGILAAIGLLLALGFAIEARTVAVRAVASGTLPVLAPTLYFTFSRGALLALAIGGATALALHPRRLRLSAHGLVVVTPAAVAVTVCSQADALTHAGTSLAQAAPAGHRIALALAGLVVSSALLGLVTARIAPRLVVGRGVRILGSGLLTLAAVSACAALILAVAEREQPAAPAADLNQRLVSRSTSFRADYWRVAGTQYRDHPLLGAGAGSFERFWLERRPVDFDSRDAHSLYIETLAELGPIGLLLLLGAVAAPLAAATKVRGLPLAPTAAGAFVAFLAHAGIDWDWEIPSVTLAGIACGVALVAWHRQPSAELPVTSRMRAGGLALVLPLVAFVFLMHVGNAAILKSTEALAADDSQTAAAEARRARRWAPWSHEPWQRLGDAELARGHTTTARAMFREAIARDPENWLLWYDLAAVSSAREREEALEEVRRLNPLSPEAAELRRPS